MKQKHRDSKSDWRGSCDIKMNNLEFSRLPTNLIILPHLDFIPAKYFKLVSYFHLFLDFCGSNVILTFLSVGIGNLKLTKACRLE